MNYAPQQLLLSILAMPPKFLLYHPCPSPRQPLLQPLASPPLSSAPVLQPAPWSPLDPICSHCHRRLHHQTSIAIQHDHYCITCFASVLPQCQQYSVVSHGAFDVLGGGWPACDEIRMLEGIERFGFGNWSAVQEYMGYFGACYHRHQIQAHYYQYYGNNQQPQSLICNGGSLKKVHNGSKNKENSHTQAGKQLQKSKMISFGQLGESQKESIPCYNPKRGEFNIDYKQNLQKFIADLQFRDNDSQHETQLKHRILEAYNAGLLDRQRKHKFILEHRLLDQAYQAQQARVFQQDSYTQKAHQLLLNFMQALSHEQYLQMRQSLCLCLKLQAIIDSLRAIRASNLHCTLKAVGKSEPMAEELGRPRKRVHRDGEERDARVLRRLGLTREQLGELVARAQGQQGGSMQEQLPGGVRITRLATIG